MVNTQRITSFDELRTYVAIVESGSLAAAASLLGVTPNAVSRRLGILEERLGLRLIHRTTRRLSITDEGKIFHARCRRILDELDEAERELSGGDGLDGTLRVAIHSDMVCPDLMVAMREMLADSSQLRVQLRVSNSFIEPIRSGLDLGVYVGSPPASSLVSVPLGTLVWGLAAAPIYLERHGRPGSPTELVHHECLRVMRDRPETYWELSKGNGKAKRFAISGRFETTDGQALIEALYAGVGIGVQLRSSIGSAVRAGTLEPVLPAWQWASTPLYALLPKGRTKRPSIRLLLDVLRRATHSLS